MVSVLVSVADTRATKPLPLKRFRMEARVGIEPTDEAFAEPCLTTWLPRRERNDTIIFFLRPRKFNRNPMSCSFQNRNNYLGRSVNSSAGFCLGSGGAASTPCWPEG